MRMRPSSDQAFSATAAVTQCDAIARGGGIRFCAAAQIALASVLLCLPSGAFAQEAQSGGEAVGRALDAMHIRAEPAPAADFVERARPDRNSLNYKPMAPTEKSLKKKTPAELDALGAELESSLARNRRAAARVKIPDPQSGR
jgi:hypothetical protein